MKKLIVAVTVLFSFNALANDCPNLMGEYKCNVQNGDSGAEEAMYLTILQTVADGITTYDFTASMDSEKEQHTTVLITDGVSRTDSQIDQDEDWEFPVKFTNTYQAHCAANVLVIEGVTKVTTGKNFEVKTAEMKSTAEVIATSTELITETQYEVEYWDKETGESHTDSGSTTSTCTRL